MRAYFRILGQFTLSLMVIIPLGMLLFPGVVRVTRSQADPCASNQKQIALAIFQYTMDYDEKYPLIKVHETKLSIMRPWGWADALQPYMKATSVFHCPENPQYRNKPRPTNPRSWGYTDYFYNSRLSGVSMTNLEAAALTVMLGDGNDGTGGTSARYNLGTLPAKWRQNKNSPGYRHEGGAYYAFADGHVSWFSPNLITNHSVRDGYRTFAIK